MARGHLERSFLSRHVKGQSREEPDQLWPGIIGQRFHHKFLWEEIEGFEQESIMIKHGPRKLILVW